MYRVSPFTYMVSAVLSVGLAQTDVKCSSIELLTLSPPTRGETCQSFLSNYTSYAGGQIINPDATTNCQFCSIATTDDFLAAESIYFSDRWRDIGILFGYCAFNVAAAIGLYWLARVPKGNRVKEVPGESGNAVAIVKTRSQKEGVAKEVK
jgi:ATP-binding cassette, subfamily G (WHITE), member 2, PDR